MSGAIRKTFSKIEIDFTKLTSCFFIFLIRATPLVHFIEFLVGFFVISRRESVEKRVQRFFYNGCTFSDFSEIKKIIIIMLK